MPTQSALLSIRHHRERANKAESDNATLREQVKLLRECIDTSLEYMRQHGAEGDGTPAIQAAETILVDALAATEPKETT